MSFEQYVTITILLRQNRGADDRRCGHYQHDHRAAGVAFFDVMPST